jgi:hypothetical protein
MEKADEFINRMRSRFLDAINNHLMHLQKAQLEEFYETREALIDMLVTEAEFLQKKRDSILAEINAFLTGSA